MSSATIHIDGGSRGNPGPASFAVVVTPADGPPVELAEPIGTATNNVAEYTALIRGLELAKELGFSRLAVFSDSELIVKQMNGEYKVKNADMVPLFEEARGLRRGFEAVTLTHVRREQNKRADFLCNEALDGRPRRPGQPAPAEVPRPTPPRAAPPAKVTDDAVREDVLQVLAAAAREWATKGVNALPVEAVWEQVWSILDDGGVLKRKK